MEVFVELQVVAEVRIRLLHRVFARARAEPAGVDEEEPGEACGQFVGNFAQAEERPRPGWALDAEVVPVICVELPQRLDYQVVHRHPDRPAPVGVSPKEAAVRLTGLIRHGMLHPAKVHAVRMLFMELRQRAHAVRRQEFALVEHAAQQLLHAVPAQERQQLPAPNARHLPSRDQGREIRPVLEEPVHAFPKPGQALDEIRA